MLLGKRPRFPIKRTTSMSGINVNLDDVVSEESSAGELNGQNMTVSYSALISPKNVGHHSDHFLGTCGLCRRRLASGRDIYMYRGDTAYCSYECREKQIKEDQRKQEKTQTVARAAYKSETVRSL